MYLCRAGRDNRTGEVEGPVQFACESSVRMTVLACCSVKGGRGRGRAAAVPSVEVNCGPVKFQISAAALVQIQTRQARTRGPSSRHQVGGKADEARDANLLCERWRST